jgi:glyoxylase-like metal-dependent hydrolase (beta-lactamase superfamily II)
VFFQQRPSISSSLAYFLGCGGEGKGIAVDVAAGDEPWFMEQAKKINCTITHVIDTHVHADHYSGGSKLAALVGAPYCLQESACPHFPFEKLHDRERIEVGNVHIDVLHTPGHTLDSVCLLVADRRRSPEPWFVITGDTLFVGSVGRPDLAGREREMAGMLFDSLHSRLLSLPNDIEIFPGHQAGSVCGTGLSGKASSTLGFEKRFNPALQFGKKAEFIDYVVRDIPPRPADMDRIIAVNLGHDPA